jgi:hypothetical protein
MSNVKPKHKASAAEGYDHSEPQALSITLFSLATILTLVLVIVGVQFYFDKIWDKAVHDRVLAPPSEELKSLHAREDSQLFRYSYVDKGKGVVRVPVDRAMELYSKEASEGKYFHPVKPMAPKPEQPEGQAAEKK